MSDAAAGSNLLEPGFLAELEALRRRLRVKARSAGAGDLLAKRRGGSAEFEDHRGYVPGDDLRRVDWAAYARTGEPVVKLFRAEEDVLARILVDTSSSLDFGTPTKLEVAQRLAAAVGYMLLSSSQRAQVFSMADRAVPTSIPRRGRGGLASFLRSLSELRASGKTNIARSIQDVMARSARPGLLVVISDFFDPGPTTSALRKAHVAGHDIVLIQVVTPEEVEPAQEGDWLLEDAETGQVVDVTMDPEALEAYMLRFAGLCEELRALARSFGGSYVRVRTDDSLAEAVRRVVSREID